MIFTGEKNLYVRISRKNIVRLTGVRGFQFDENGEYQTDNDLLCRFLKQYFPVKEEVKKGLPADGLYNCKKCDFSTPKKGELMQHYKHMHPKEE